MFYIANVGDSRALLSAGGGKQIINLSKDHRPDTDEERKRIIEAGG
jgi:protein phosphatase 2C family protein 2/3